MKNIVILFFFITLISCSSNKKIISNKENDTIEIHNIYKIYPSTLKLNLMAEYSEKHYGYSNYNLINPQIIVVHSTETRNLQIALNVFQNDFLIGRKDIDSGGDVNVGTHFLVDTNGTIYASTPLEYMARHTIGLNYTAISIENIGFAGQLTKQQLNSNIKLIKYLKNHYKSIKYVIGHYEYRDTNSPHYHLFREIDPTYRFTIKTDPGYYFMQEIKQRIH
ncbi:peptidoglycan recognition family protein [uncultured Brachyspira sp.]|uniref:peptidoglycan recognition protein family protein n=1 Tax=uncultured Brachyspira sp. TaxID=221953 RepID=UPI002601E32E|nr:peptidoglycan recognition family protein [uncultured Brachyspira sp.]